MENKGGAVEVGLGAPEAVEGVVLDEGEATESGETKAELPVISPGEKVPATLPPLVLTVSGTDDASAQDDVPEVDKDAERMPKEYAKHLAAVMRKYKKEPNELQRSVTGLKWDYMQKAFGRKLGDGLDGKAKD